MRLRTVSITGAIIGLLALPISGCGGSDDEPAPAATATPAADAPPANSGGTPYITPNNIYFNGEVRPSGDATMGWGDIGFFELNGPDDVQFEINLATGDSRSRVVCVAGATGSFGDSDTRAIKEADIATSSPATLSLVAAGTCKTIPSSAGIVAVTVKRFTAGAPAGDTFGRVFATVRRRPLNALRQAPYSTGITNLPAAPANANDSNTVLIDIGTNACPLCDLTSRDEFSYTAMIPWREFDLRYANLSGLTIDAATQAAGVDPDDFIYAGDWRYANLAAANILVFAGDGKQAGGMAGFPGVPTSGAIFNGATLMSDVTAFDFRGADLAEATLLAVICSGTSAAPRLFDGADFTGATVEDSDFSYTDWSHATGRPAKFGKNVMQCASFRGVNFTIGDSVAFSDLAQSLRDSWPQGLAGSDCHVDLTRATILRADLAFDLFRRFNFDGVTIKSGDATLDAQETPFIGFNFPAGTDFSYARAQNWHFGGAVFPNATAFDHADLTNSTFESATIQNASLTGANLGGANFTATDLTGSTFDGADLATASDGATSLPGVFAGAHLVDADLTTATIDNVDFYAAVITRSNARSLPTRIVGVNFEQANLSSTRLDGGTVFQGDVKFDGAILIGATLQDAQMQQATGQVTMRGAYLQGVNLSGANLSGVDLENAQTSAEGGVVAITEGPNAGSSPSYDATTLFNTTTDETTQCPSGSKYFDGCGSDLTSDRWQVAPTFTPPVVCCVWKSGDPPCPRAKPAGKSCTSKCDCASRICDSGTQTCINASQ